MLAAPLLLALCWLLIVGCGDNGVESAHPATLLWEDQYDGGDSAGRHEDLAYAVAVCDGRVFAVGRTQSEDGSSSAWLVRAHDAANGALMWEARYPGNGYAEARQVACDNERVFVAGEGTLRAYLNDDGTLLWSRVNEDRTPNSYWALTADRGSVFWFATGVYDSEGTTLTVLSALDPESGAVGWEDATVIASPQGWGFGGIGASATMVCTGWDSHTEGTRSLRCLDRNTGDLVWSKSFRNRRARGSSVTPRFAPDGSSVAFAGSRGGNDFVAAYRSRDGQLRWSRQYDFPVDLARPAAAGSDFFVAGVQFVGHDPGYSRDVFFVSALDVHTGDVRWEDRRFDEQPAALVLEGQRVVAVGTQWESRVYRSDSGSLLVDDSILDSYLAEDAAAEHGRYFVTGSLPSASGDGDFALRAYSTR